MSGHGLDSASPTPQASSTLWRRILLGRSIIRAPSNLVLERVRLDPPQSTREASSSVPVQVQAQSHSQPSLLQHAQNLGISGGSFVNAGGDYVNPHVTYSGNITIHNHHESAQRHVEDDPRLAATASFANQGSSPVNVDSEIPEDNPLPSPPATQKSCDTYSRLLAVKGRGFPLWIPGPSANLPIEYRRAGIAIGDVGILTKSGSFDFLFNICLPKNHPINQAGVPDGFYPLDNIPRSDILRHDEFDAGSHVASTFVETVRYNNTLLTNELSFESSAREGAILTMPHGAVAQDLASVIHFEDYMAQHSENWYKYIIGVRGRKIGNGDVRLIVGADMASAWGMATFSQLSAECSPLQLKFKPTAASPACETYSWEYSGTPDAKSGPTSSEIQRLHSDDNADTVSRYINQSLFVRTLTATFEKTTWDKLMSGIRIARASRKSPNVYSLLGTSKGTSSATINKNTTTWTRANPDNRAETQPEPSLYIVSDTTNTIAHPSNKINDLLIKMVQDMFSDETPRMIITKDQDWISVLDTNDLVLPSGEELYRRIMDTESLEITITNNGVLLLQHVNNLELTTALPTEIHSPTQRIGPLPEERSNMVSQLSGYDRDDPKDHFTTEIMSSDKGSHYITFVPPSPPPLDSVFDLAPITSPLLPYTSSYSVSYHSPYSQYSELAFSDDDIQMQEDPGGMNEYEPSDYDAPNQSASLFMFTIDSDCMPQQQQSLPRTNSDPWNLNFLSATLGLEKMDVGSERGDDFPTQASQTSDPGYHHHPLSSLIDSTTAASTALLFPPSNNSPGMGHFHPTSSSTRSDHGAKVWGSSMSSYHSLGSTTATSTALLFPPSNNPPGMDLFRRASSSTWSDRGAEVWGSSGRQKHHRMSPYPSPNASPRVRHTDLELDPNLTVVGTGLSDLHDPPVGGRECSQTCQSPDSNVPSTSQIEVLSSQIPKVNVTTGSAANTSHRRRKQDANFTCAVPGCGSTFTRGFSLKAHLRSHAEFKFYKCHWPGCGKEFVRQHDCKRHEELHSNFRPFECEGCTKQFSKMDALNRHLKSKAGVECARIMERGKRAGSGGMGMWNSEGGYNKGEATMSMRDGIVELGRKLEEEKRQTGSGGSRGDGWAGVAL